MSNGTGKSCFFSLFLPWSAALDMRDVYPDAMAEAMASFVNTEAYAQANGAMLDAYLSVAAPLRKAMDDLMPQVLAFYGMPSRHELASVAARMTNIEIRLDDMEVKLDEIARAFNARAEVKPINRR